MSTMSAVATMSEQVHGDKRKTQGNPNPVTLKPIHNAYLRLLLPTAPCGGRLLGCGPQSTPQRVLPSQGSLSIGDVIALKRNCVEPLCQLDLEDH